MPTYEYACTECGEQLEVVQSFTDEALTECPLCKGRLRKIFGNVGVTFKGSGFYKTDSRKSSSAASAKSNESSGSSNGSSSEKSSDSKPAESKPASSDTKPATPSPSSDSKTS